MVKSNRGRARRYGRNPFIKVGPAQYHWVKEAPAKKGKAGTGWAAAAKRAKKKYAAKQRAAKMAERRAATIASGKKPRRKAVPAAKAMAMRKARAHRANLRRARTYAGGKFKAVRAHFGPYATKDTFAYASKRGTLKKIPRYALLGFTSAKQMAAAMKADEKIRGRVERRVARFDAQREHAASRIRKSGGLFAPNSRRRPRVISFATWESQMKLSRGRRKARKSYTMNKRTKRGARKTTKRRTARRSKVTRRRSKVTRRRPVVTRRRRVVRRRPVTTRRRTTRRISRRTYRANPTKSYGKARKVKRVSLSLYSRNAEGATLTPNPKRRRTGKRRGLSMSFKGRFKSARKVKGFRVRGYSRNPFARNAAQFKEQIMEALSVGAVAGAGFLMHRALTRLVTYKAPWFKDQMAIDALNPVPEMIAAAGVALVGVPLAAKFAPGKAKLLAAGMIADLLVLGLQKLLYKYDSQAQVTPYLAGLGSYYTLPARRPMGEYVQMSGLGQIRQAAAGMGRFQQAAAGFGRLQQAAAGFGQLRQAAAGVGEYVATDLEGIGDYIEVTPELTAAADVDNGIMPSLSEAEAALNVAEGANGIGNQRVPAQFIVDPVGQNAPLAEDDMGDRSGAFSGRDGIFGPLQ